VITLDPGLMPFIITASILIRNKYGVVAEVGSLCLTIILSVSSAPEENCRASWTKSPKKRIAPYLTQLPLGGSSSFPKGRHWSTSIQKNGVSQTGTA